RKHTDIVGVVVPEGHVVTIKPAKALERPKRIEVVIQNGDFHAGSIRPTHTRPLRNPYTRSVKMKSDDTPRSGDIWSATQGASRGGGLHAGRAGNDCGAVGSCRERTRARRATTPPCRDRACAVRSSRSDRPDA